MDVLCDICKRRLDGDEISAHLTCEEKWAKRKKARECLHCGEPVKERNMDSHHECIGEPYDGYGNDVQPDTSNEPSVTDKDARICKEYEECGQYFNTHEEELCA